MVYDAAVSISAGIGQFCFYNGHRSAGKYAKFTKLREKEI